eukprot:PLAT3651.3.p2 GENE.PLAT3651.3~~PLAT3651.3.p2  ORF type:complete len:312 (+),score=179.51 PLAT3651.3:557-1492(+)
MLRRADAWRDKRTKLRSPMFFISPNRLSVRNLAFSVDSAELSKLALKAATLGLQRGKAPLDDIAPPLRKLVRVGRKPRIVKAMVMRQRGPLPSDAGESKGFGFVEFADHMQALAALRMLNNNPAFTRWARGGSRAVRKGGDKPRLMVDFAVENHEALHVQKKRQQAAARKQKLFHRAEQAASGDGPAPKKKAKLSRGRRQREQRRAARGAKEASDGDDAAAARSKSTRGKKGGSTHGRKRERAEMMTEEALVADVAPPARKRTRKERRERKPKRKVDRTEEGVQAAIASYRSSLMDEESAAKSRERARWFD